MPPSPPPSSSSSDSSMVYAFPSLLHHCPEESDSISSFPLFFGFFSFVILVFVASSFFANPA